MPALVAEKNIQIILNIRDVQFILPKGFHEVWKWQRLYFKAWLVTMVRKRRYAENKCE